MPNLQGRRMISAAIIGLCDFSGFRTFIFVSSLGLKTVLSHLAPFITVEKDRRPHVYE